MKEGRVCYNPRPGFSTGNPVELDAVQTLPLKIAREMPPNDGSLLTGHLIMSLFVALLKKP